MEDSRIPELLALGQRVKSARHERGFSQRELAVQWRVNYAQVCRFESGLEIPGPRLALLVAAFLGDREENVLSVVSAVRVRTSQQARQKAITPDAIEEFAAEDRRLYLDYLRRVGRERLGSSTDKRDIARELCNLTLICDDFVLQSRRLVYGALFVGDEEYRATRNVIAISRAKVRRAGQVSEQTQLFHVLHEVGHFKLHWKAAEKNSSQAGATYCSAGDRSRVEEQANAYAAAFLMPAGEVRAAVSPRKTVNATADFRRLCDLFFVEPWMLRFRLARLGIAVFNDSRTIGGRGSW